MTITENILKEASKLTPIEKAQLIDKLISIPDKPDKEIDKWWAGEAEDIVAIANLHRKPEYWKDRN